MSACGTHRNGIQKKGPLMLPRNPIKGLAMIGALCVGDKATGSVGTDIGGATGAGRHELKL